MEEGRHGGRGAWRRGVSKERVDANLSEGSRPERHVTMAEGAGEEAEGGQGGRHGGKGYQNPLILFWCS